MKEEDKSKLIEVFTGSPWEAELVKSLLGNSDIEAVTKDGMVVNVVLPATAVDVSVLVNEKDYEAAIIPLLLWRSFDSSNVSLATYTAFSICLLEARARLMAAFCSR